MRLRGPDAEAVLQFIFANNTAVPVGSVIYTSYLNDRGGMESDGTLTRLGES